MSIEENVKLKITSNSPAPNVSEDDKKKIRDSAMSGAKEAARAFINEYNNGGGNGSGGGGGGSSVVQNVNITENGSGSGQLTEAAMAMRAAAEHMEGSLGRLSEVVGGFAEASNMFQSMREAISEVRAAAEANRESNRFDSYSGRIGGQDDIDQMLETALSHKNGILGAIGSRLAKDRMASRGAGIDLNDKDYSRRYQDIRKQISDVLGAENGETRGGDNVVDVLSNLIDSVDGYHRKTRSDIRDRKGMTYNEALGAWEDRRADTVLKAQQRAAEEAAAAAQAEKARAEEGVKLDRTQKQNERLDSVKRDTDRSNPTKQQSGDVDINTKGDVHIDSRNTSGVNGNGPGGSGGGSGGSQKDRPMYLNKLSELTDLLKEEGLDNIADEVKRQLAVLKSNEKDLYGSTASNIAATFGSDGSFQGFTLKAKSITLGDVDTATMSYKVGDDMVTTTRANQDKLAKFTERLAQDTASAEQQFNMWMGHSALQSKDASGHNNRVDQLMGYLTGSNGQQLGYVDKKGQVQIGRLNAAGQKETLTRTELDELQNNLGIFRNEMSVLNRSMRQDFAQNGIDVIGQKHDKLLAERDLLKTRLTSMGLKQNDTLRNGDSLASLFGRINAAEGRYKGAAGNVDAQVKAYNDLHDAIKQADAAVQGEMRTRSASMALTREDIRTQNVLSKAQTAMSAKNADAQTSIMKTLQKSINQLESAGTPEEKLRALNSITQQTSKLTKATSEYNAQAKHMSKLDSQLGQMRTQLKEAGDLQAPESMRLAAKAMQNFNQSKTPKARNDNAALVEKYIQQARDDVNRAVKVENTAAVKFDRDAKKAENQYSRITKNDLLAEADRAEIEKAYKAFNKGRNDKTLEGLQQALGKATDNIAKTDKGNKTAEVKARIDAKQLALNTAKERAGGQDNWSTANKDLFEKAQEELNAAKAQLESGSIKNARSFLGRATTDLGSLNVELGKSETAIKKAAEAQEQKRKEDEMVDKANALLTSPDSQLYGKSKTAQNLQSALDQVNQIRNSGTGDMAKAMENLTNAMKPAEAAVNKFDQDASRAEQRYKDFTSSGMINGLSQKQQDMISNAYKAFQQNQTGQTLHDLVGALTGGENALQQRALRDKGVSAQLSLLKARDKLTGFDERSDSGRKLTDEQKTMRGQVGQFYAEAEKQINKGDWSGAQKSIQDFNSVLGTLTSSFNRSETAAKAAANAQEAQRKEDEKAAAAEAKELVKQGVKTETAQNKAERNAFYGDTKESSRDRLTDAAAIFKATGSADDLQEFQKALTKVQWEEKAAQLKDYNKQLAMMANPTGMPGVDLSSNWAAAQLAMRDEILKMQDDFKAASRANDQARADSILKQIGITTSDLSKSLDQTKQLNDAAKALETTGNYSRVSQSLKDDLTAAMDAMNNAAPDKFLESMNAVRGAISAISNEMKSIGVQDYWNQQTTALQNYNNALDGLKAQHGAVSGWTNSQQAAYAQAQNAFGRAQAAINAGDTAAYKLASEEGTEKLNALNQSFKEIGALSANSKPQVDALSRSLMNFAAPMMLFRKFTGYMKKAAQNVSAIDSQMADLKKVTNNTDAEYQMFLQRAGQHAVQIGSSITDLVATTSTFAHMGYDLNQSQALGVTATKFANVGGFKNTTDAADTIIAAIKGFKDLNIGDADEVGDKLTAVANNYAVTATDISEGLRHSASALNVAGNDIDQSTAMITAIAEVTRDAGGAGSALKVLSMRIRGAKAELQDAGESTEGMAESTAKLRAEVYGLTNVGGKGGVDIMADEETFKSTYDILQGISKVWGKMSDINRSALLEKLAGKVRSNQVAALLENFDQAERVLETSQNAQGTMSKVHARWLDSVEARQAQFKAAQETASMAAMPAGTLKDLYQAGTTGLGLLTQLMGYTGSGGVGLGVLGTAAALKSGAGNIWAGIGNALNMHVGGMGQKDLVNAYNLAFSDATNASAYHNKAGAMAAAENVTGQTANAYTKRLVDQANGTVDAARATSTLAASLKGLAKNALGAVATFGAIELASWGAQAAWNWLDHEVINKGKYLAQAADTAYAEYKQASQNATANEEQTKTLQVQIDELRGKENKTPEETQQLASLESQMRSAELTQKILDLQAKQAARNTLKTESESFRTNYTGMSTQDLYTDLASAVFLVAQQKALDAWEKQGVGTKKAQLLEEAQILGGAASRIGMESSLEEYLSTPEGQRAAAIARQKGYDVSQIDAEQWFDIKTNQYEQEKYKSAVAQGKAFKDLGDLLVNNKLTPQALAEGYNVLGLHAESVSNSLSQWMDEQSDDKLKALGANTSNDVIAAMAAVGNVVATMADDYETQADMLITSYVGGGYSAKEEEIDSMRKAFEGYVALRKALDSNSDSFDALTHFLNGTEMGEALSKLLELGAAGELTAESIKGLTVDGIKNAGTNFSILLSSLGIDIGEFASTLNSHVKQAKEPEDNGEGPKIPTVKSSQERVDATRTAQDLGAKLWKSTGYTGALDPSSKEYQELMAMDDGAYQAAIKHANGTLFFDKDAFDQAVQEKFKSELDDLKKDTAEAESKYAEAATRYMGLLQKKRAGESYDDKAYQSAMDDLELYGGRLSDYRSMASQISYGMSGLANWMSNKNGAEAGDAYDELGAAVQALREGKQSGMVGTREFAAALKFYGTEGLNPDDLSNADWNLIGGIAGVDANGKANKALRTRTLQQFQKEMQKLGILDENFAVIDPNMTTEKMAEMYNAKYGTHLNGEVVQAAFMAMNDYIYDSAKKYTFTNNAEAAQDPKVVEAEKAFADAVKAYTENADESQEEAKFQAVQAAAQSYVDAMNKSLIGSGNKEAALQAALSASATDPLTSAINKLTGVMEKLVKSEDQNLPPEAEQPGAETESQPGANAGRAGGGQEEPAKTEEPTGDTGAGAITAETVEITTGGEVSVTPEGVPTAPTPYTSEESKAFYDQQMARQKWEADREAEREAALKSDKTGSPTDQRIAEARERAARLRDRAQADEAANAFLNQFADQLEQMPFTGPLHEAHTALVAGMSNPDVTGDEIREMTAELQARLAEQQEYDDAKAVSAAYERRRQERRQNEEKQNRETLHELQTGVDEVIEASDQDTRESLLTLLDGLRVGLRTDTQSTFQAKADELSALITERRQAQADAEAARQEALDGISGFLNSETVQGYLQSGDQQYDDLFTTLYNYMENGGGTAEEIQTLFGQLRASYLDKLEKERAAEEAEDEKALNKALAQQPALQEAESYLQEAEESGISYGQTAESLKAAIADENSTAEEISHLSNQLSQENRLASTINALNEVYDNGNLSAETKKQLGETIGDLISMQAAGVVGAEEEINQALLEASVQLQNARQETQGAAVRAGTAGNAETQASLLSAGIRQAGLDELKAREDEISKLLENTAGLANADDAVMEKWAALDDYVKDTTGVTQYAPGVLNKLVSALQQAAEQSTAEPRQTPAEDETQTVSTLSTLGHIAKNIGSFALQNLIPNAEEAQPEEIPITPLPEPGPEEADAWQAWVDSGMQEDWVSFLQKPQETKEQEPTKETAPTEQPAQPAATQNRRKNLDLARLEWEEQNTGETFESFLEHWQEPTTPAQVADQTAEIIARELGERPIVSGADMQKAGWTDVPEDDYATVYTSTYTGNGKTVLATPITPTGEVLTEEQLNEYVSQILESGLSDIFDADTRGLILAAMQGEDQSAIARMDEYAENLHLQQEAQYGTGTGQPGVIATRSDAELEALYDQAEELNDTIGAYLNQYGMDGNEELWNAQQELQNAYRSGDDTNIGKLVKNAEELLKLTQSGNQNATEQSEASNELLTEGFEELAAAGAKNISTATPGAEAAQQEGKQSLDVGVDYDVPEVEIPQPEDLTVGVVADTKKAQEELNSLSASATVTVNWESGGMPDNSNSKSDSEGSKGGNTISVSGLARAATGTTYARSGPYLVDEVGQELIEHVSRGTYELGTNEGPRFTKLEAGDIVHTARETKRILRRGQAMANGGKVTTGQAFSGIGSGAATGPGSTIPTMPNTNQSTMKAQSSPYMVTQDPQWLYTSEQILRWLQSVVDWIPTFLAELKKMTNKFVEAADDVVHYSGKNQLVDEAINNISNEINANVLAAMKYREFLIGLAYKGAIPMEALQDIQKGTLEIQKFEVGSGADDTMIKTIQAYQQYWQKLVACQDALKTLNDQMEALSQQKMTNIIKYFDQMGDLLASQKKTYETLIDLKKQYGEEINVSDYTDSLHALQDILENSQNEETAIVAELSDQLGIGEDLVKAILDGGRDVWEAIGERVKKGIDKGIEDLTSGLDLQNEALTEGLRTGEIPTYWSTIQGQKEITDQESWAYAAFGSNGPPLVNILEALSSDTSAYGPSFSNDQRTIGGMMGIIPKEVLTKNGYIAMTGEDAQIPNPELLWPVDTSTIELPVKPTLDEDIIAIGEMLGMNMADGSEEALANFEKVKSLFTTTWDNPLAIGSETWYSYMSTLEELRENIYSTQIEISEMNDEIANIPLTNLKTGYNYLEDIRKNLEGVNSLLDAQGASKSPGVFSSLISVGMEEIENLQEQNKLIEAQMSSLDPLSEKYQELRDDLNDNLDAIADIRENQERWNDALIDLQIDQLRKQNEKYKEQLSLMRALDDLENARQRRILTYHEMGGFVYEADEDALEAAQESATDAVYNSMMSELERQKETSNIYGPLGERLIQGASIVDSLGNILVPVEDKLSGLDFGSYYQSILDGAEQSGLLTNMLNSIDMAKLLESSIGGNVSIDLSGMTLNEVNDVKDLCDAIMQQLPNYLLQAMYQKGA